MSKHAQLYRMNTSQHICPFGIKSKDLLVREGYNVEDILLTSREQIDEFKQQHSVDTTPQTFIGSQRIGGYDQLRSFFNKPQTTSEETTYTPVIAIFIISLLLSLAVIFSGYQQASAINTVMLFVAFTMTILAVQKLQDLFSFTNSFITYDLLAMKVVRYAYVYPFMEAYVGIGMVANLPPLSVAPIALFIGGVGAISVTKAVYIDKRDLKCACVGGNSNVPLGFISLTENLFMIAAGVWMLAQ